MNAPTAADVARSDACHGPLARCRAASAAARFVLAVVFTAALTGVMTGAMAGAAGDAGSASSSAVAHAVRLGVAVGAAAVPGGLLAGLWRELVHEPAHGPAAATVPAVATGRVGISLVVGLDVVVGAVVRAVATAVVVSAVIGWRAAPPVVAVGVIPVGMAAAVLPAGALARRARLAFDRSVPIPADRLPSPLARLDALVAPGVRAQWYRGGPTSAARGEGAVVLGSGSRPAIVVAPDVLDGPPALLDAVAAHELGHVLTGVGCARSRWFGPAVAWGAGVAVGAALPVVPGLDAPGPWHVLAVLGLVTVLGPVDARWSRRREAAADRWAADRVVDPVASATEVYRRLVADGVDLRPHGLRRWWASHPPVDRRLSVLTAGKVGFIEP